MLTKYVLLYIFFSSRNELVQTYLNDPNILEKVDLSKPLAAITHGWTDSINSVFCRVDGKGNF